MADTELLRLADRLAQCLRLHRADLHLQDDRPCETCAESKKALAAYDEYRARPKITIHEGPSREPTFGAGFAAGYEEGRRHGRR